MATSRRVLKTRVTRCAAKILPQGTRPRQAPGELTMAHRTLPFGTHVRVTNLENRQSVEVVVNDRGPFVDGRIADVSEAAARRLGMITDGVVEALLQILQR